MVTRNDSFVRFIFNRFSRIIIATGNDGYFIQLSSDQFLDVRFDFFIVFFYIL